MLQGWKYKGGIAVAVQVRNFSAQKHARLRLSALRRFTNITNTNQHATMVFGRKTAPATTPANDYGAPAVRSNKLHRPLLAANHALHTISSLIVLGISAYFINEYTHNTHLRYWVALVCYLSFPPTLP